MSDVASLGQRRLTIFLAVCGALGVLLTLALPFARPLAGLLKQESLELSLAIGIALALSIVPVWGLIKALRWVGAGYAADAAARTARATPRHSLAPTRRPRSAAESS